MAITFWLNSRSAADAQAPKRAGEPANQRTISSALACATDSHLEMSALAEMMAARYPGEEPALLFDNIPGFPKRFRVLSCAANSRKRLAHVLRQRRPLFQRSGDRNG
jgi:hypothetical protein